MPNNYLGKPFIPRELLARVRTVLRRRHAEVRQAGRRACVRTASTVGSSSSAPAAGRARRPAVPLGRGEFHLLVALLGAPQRVLSREQLLDLSRLHNDDVYNRSVDVQILRIRRKMKPDPTAPRYIRTRRAMGYMFSVPVEVVYSI